MWTAHLAMKVSVKFHHLLNKETPTPLIMAPPMAMKLMVVVVIRQEMVVEQQTIKPTVEVVGKT